MPLERSCARDLVVALARRSLQPVAITQRIEAEILGFCKADVARRTLKIAADLERGAMRAARRKADDLRSCLAARLLALWTSLPGHSRGATDCLMSEEAYATVRAQRWAMLADNIDEVGRCTKPAIAELRAKPKGPPGMSHPRQYRPIIKFGWIDQARQRLIGASLVPFVDFHPSQRLLQQCNGRRGRSAVCEALLRRLPELGQDHVFVQLDVQRFYQSVDHAWLEDNLPLPKGMIRAQVHTGGMAFSPIRNRVRARLDRSGGALENLARRGLPTGSALSPLVGEYVMAEALRGLADHPDAPLLCVHSPDLHTYSDNIGMVVEQAKAAAVVDLYRKAFASSAAGPFSITVSPPQPARGPFKFLGYWFRMRDGKAEAYVPDDEAERRIDIITQDILTASASELEQMHRRIEGVAADWRYWNQVDAWRVKAKVAVYAAEWALGCSAECNRLQDAPQ